MATALKIFSITKRELPAGSKGGHGCESVLAGRGPYRPDFVFSKVFYPVARKRTGGKKHRPRSLLVSEYRGLPALAYLCDFKEGSGFHYRAVLRHADICQKPFSDPSGKKVFLCSRNGQPIDSLRP